MAERAFEVTVRGHLDTLAATVGGEWALLEVRGSGPHVLATTDALAAELGAPDWAAAVEAARAGGVCIPLGTSTAPAPGAGRQGVTVTRTLVGVAIPGGVPGAPVAGLLGLVGELLGSLAAAHDRAEEDRIRAERLELSASTDPLTGLLNRRGWDRLLALEEDRCERHGLDAEIVIIDLDGLKGINDRYGHEAGDALLVRAATYIFSAVRVHDAVARLGGDEFAVLAVGTEAGAEAIADRIERCLEEAHIEASVGSAGRRKGTLADACRTADVRMYRVKQRRRGGRRGAPDPVEVDDRPPIARPSSP